MIRWAKVLEFDLRFRFEIFLYIWRQFCCQSFFIYLSLYRRIIDFKLKLFGFQSRCLSGSMRLKFLTMQIWRRHHILHQFCCLILCIWTSNWLLPWHWICCFSALMTFYFLFFWTLMMPLKRSNHSEYHDIYSSDIRSCDKHQWSMWFRLWDNRPIWMWDGLQMLGGEIHLCYHFATFPWLFCHCVRGV